MNFRKVRNDDEDDFVATKEMRQKLEEYASFVDKTLHPQLQRAVKAREEVEHEISEYNDLKQKLSVISKRGSGGDTEKNKEEKAELKKDAAIPSQDQNSPPSPPPLEAMVDLGHQLSYCRAIVEDPTTVFVHVGMGFHVEFQLPEAIVFIDKRILYLERKVLPKKVESAQHVARDLEAAICSLEVLGKDLREREEEEEEDADGEEIKNSRRPRQMMIQ